METLSDQFKKALSNIEPDNADHRASRARTEVDAALATSDDLREVGLQTVGIRSHARSTAIRPPKDIDVFAKLTKQGDVLEGGGAA